MHSLYRLSREEGGRHTPVFSGYRPQFYFRTTAMPGDVVDKEVQLLPDRPIAMEEGVRFAIREGGRTVGSGSITKILQ